MVKRIGLTMRVAEAVEYNEQRDCIAWDWSIFFKEVLPDVAWLVVPNLGADVIEYVRSWGLEGFIFSGGNDLGENPRRDETEEALLHLALSERLPVFGVCRGLQLVSKVLGGSLKRCSRENHVAVSHPVRIVDGSLPVGAVGEIRDVNSFHAQAVPVEELPPVLRAFAVTEDGWAEGIYHREAPVVAVQWHPERYRPFDERDRRLVRRALGLEG